jgi:acyl dehydratase
MDPISPNNDSMMNGLFFEEFLTDRNYFTNRRTITETDHINFISSFGFFEPLFMDQAYVATETPYGGRIVPGALTFSVSEGLTILSGILHGTGLAFLEVELKVLKPVFIGDTITVEIAVLAKRETKKTDRGIITFFQRVINQDNISVMEYKIKRMIRRKPEQ